MNAVNTQIMWSTKANETFQERQYKWKMSTILYLLVQSTPEGQALEWKHVLFHFPVTEMVGKMWA